MKCNEKCHSEDSMRFCSQSDFIALIFYIRDIKHANKIYVQQQTLRFVASTFVVFPRKGLVSVPCSGRNNYEKIVSVLSTSELIFSITSLAYCCLSFF